MLLKNLYSLSNIHSNLANFFLLNIYMHFGFFDYIRVPGINKGTLAVSHRGIRVAGESKSESKY